MKRLLAGPLVILFIVSACSPAQSVSAEMPSTPTSMPPVPFTETPVQIISVPLPDFAPDPDPMPLRRGVNMSNALEAPREGDWGLIIQEEYFELVRQAGFDFVRLPVTWNGHALDYEPYTIDPLFFFRVDQVLGWAIERDLNIIIELHSYPEIMSNPWGQKERFLAIWRQLAERYQNYPPNLIFELLNEPHGEIHAAMWNDYVRETLAVIRQTNPTREVVIGSVNWSTHDWVSTLDVPDDPNIIVTFHYYSPFEFTHQGAEWVVNSNPWLGTTWEGAEQQKDEIAHHFESVADWARRHNVRILLGEFGAYSKADTDSRVRWTEFVRTEAGRHGFAWAYWEFGAGFGVYDPSARVWRENLLKALIP
jgi:endoglucanase